ncbi:MAG: 2-C-methyl-D-erythritol 4-phosphate cytidylyltransferase [Armatimonadota bacterium]|nr:2-C-methyl-D-erythritol 4-phosphate cytidylyltransferase [Armatimonadota bacterium]MDR7439147.1 2-C-methyl-D-erythritol 4-phosphate cytidylyltransferase [Armatimonadota bacterium]MDR7562132.1 2-C-methyl-D-erythritol 4-phosphate cytidylyltransferase [Armatimonadota bacterium]MDR7567519.1 2-C-methyl-D-erythritol 4-phosphate cytidylyltransferase [Armatimonadota bacterium]MDR7602468.1 2-C-methyl-D-erythritol 4-phosphate cytidylyltransferase [Armatimonadota bacterium]
MRAGAIIAAAGQGNRLGTEEPKALVMLAGLPLAVRAALPFQRCPLVEEVVVVAPEGNLEAMRTWVQRCGLSKVHTVVAGGVQRQDSVNRGLEALRDAEVVLVHDGARPLLEEELIERVARAAAEYGAAIPALPVHDTLKRVRGGIVEQTVDRTGIWAVQTPQGFQAQLLRAAHARARAEGFYGTDDAVLVERLGHPVRVVPGSVRNLKITTREDLWVAEALLRWREGSG